ncbi:MAG: trimethylamine methyltransferase family protein [Gammaproteobacteria bacterium]|nr:MAG: trimethylamine methyltransferase family protein [Gammaproteobacteria bacterium]
MTQTSRRRPKRKSRSAGQLAKLPWKTLQYRHAPFELLGSDAIESIHRAALSILQETGMLILSTTAREYFRAAGFDTSPDSELVRFDSELIESLVQQAPSSFNLQARNPAKNLKIGDGHAVFTSVGGPAYVMDLERGRRTGSYAEMCDFIRLVQSLDILHQEGGGGFEAMDLPAASRHLDLFYAECTLLDKNWVPWTMGREQALDAIEMAAISLGQTPDDLVETPALCGIINTNTPLQLDIPMAEGLITMAEHGQASAVTPFTLSGAMAPVTLAGALALQHAEAMAGIALTQIVRPGAPVLYGGFTSNVDMKSGSPAFGTPEYLQAAQASGQLARRLGVPLRSSNVNAANAPDAQSAYESCLSLWGAISGQANMIKHAAGWLHGGLTASLEKLIIDAEILQMVATSLEPFEVNADTLALDAIHEVGPGGHFFGSAHTMERYQSAFYAPLLSDWSNYETWLESGSIGTEQHANRIWKQLLREYEQPPLDPAIDEALLTYVAQRKQTIDKAN